MANSPTEEEKRQALSKVLSSAAFEKSERARELLRYLVTQDLEGQGGKLKGFVIAMDVFGKDENFDAASDPLVRVHVGRLRELLATYYSGEGSEDQLVISVPVGRYKPEYSLNESAIAAKTAQEQDPLFGSLLAETEYTVLADKLMGRKQTDESGEGDEPVLIESKGQQDEEDIPVSPLVKRHLKGFWVILSIILALLAIILMVWSR